MHADGMTSITNKCPSRANRYKTEEERREAQLDVKRRYASKDWSCEICNKTIQLGNRSKHVQNKTHQINMSKPAVLDEV